MNDIPLPRREALRRLVALAATAAVPAPLAGCRDTPAPEETEAPAAPPEPTLEVPEASTEDRARLLGWVETLRSEPVGERSSAFRLAAARVGELAIGTPYEGFTLEAYLRAGGSPTRTEPLTLDLTKFDCVSLVESCIAIARIARSDEPPTWEAFAREMERMRYRGGDRDGYVSRLHYFSEWLADNESRGLVERRGRQLGGVPDDRPLRFMSEHPDAYPALSSPEVLEEIAQTERELDDLTRWVVPTEQIPQADPQIQTGDILAFATSIAGLDVSHAAFAYRDSNDVLRVLHAPLSGGVVEITDATLPEYVAAINQATGILVARPLDA
ncbi:MAG: N-acetylmuramoyl-L-alanine amidase-like domain-containing protein [Gemmatimonadota bacterium]